MTGDVRLAHEHAVPPGDPETAQRIRAGTYDVQEDRTTRRCAGCRSTLWADEADLCERCDCIAAYQWLARIHADRTPGYYPPRETTP